MSDEFARTCDKPSMWRTSTPLTDEYESSGGGCPMGYSLQTRITHSVEEELNNNKTSDVAQQGVNKVDYGGITYSEYLCVCVCTIITHYSHFSWTNYLHHSSY